MSETEIQPERVWKQIEETMETSERSYLRKFVLETEYESDYDDDDEYDDHDDYKLESRAVSAGLPRRGHELKHGKLLVRRGSNQQKFISARPKALVKYGKCDVSSNYNFYKETEALINSTEDITGAISTRERSVLLHYYGHRTVGQRPQEFILKVYNEQFGIQRIHKWAINEYVSAWDMLRCKKPINVPNVYAPDKNIVVLNFIGDNGVSAPSLNEVKFEITEKMYTDVITSMYNMYNHAKRVHGNMCVRNMLWWREKVYFVGLSRGVATTDPNAQELLMKDCCYVTHFFKSRGLLKVKSTMNLFKFITGLEDPDTSVLWALKNNRKNVKNRQRKKKLPRESIIIQ